jgi:hypothetical protein
MSPGWGSTPRLTDWPTVSRNVTLTLTWLPENTRVEAGSNTSTVTLRVVGGDKKGSLKFETVKYGHESQGTRTRERLSWRGSAAYTKDRPVLSPERAPQENKTVTTKTYWLTDLQSKCDVDSDFWLPENRLRPPESHLTLNGRNISFVNHVKYLGIIFDERITWRLHIKMIETKAFRTFIRIYSIFGRLSANIKLTLPKALINSVMTYACSASELAADT